MTDPDLFGDRLPDLDAERVRLRHPRPTDADAVIAIFGDPEAMRYWSHEPLESLDAARAYLDSIDEGFLERTFFQWAITERGNDRLIGTVTLGDWSRRNRRAEIGFMLSPAHQGQGIASEAVRAVLDFAFGPMDLYRIEADIDPRNAASARLLGRLGFRREGVLRDRWFTYGEWSDSYVYGLLRREYERVPGEAA